MSRFDNDLAACMRRAALTFCAIGAVAGLALGAVTGFLAGVSS